MKFNTAIFDLDGTLLDSMDIWEKIDIEFLQKRGLTVPRTYVTDICSLSFREAALYTIERFRLEETADEIIHQWNIMAEHEYSANVKIMPFAEDYLKALRKLKVKLAVATGLPERLYKPCLLNNGIYEIFDSICSTDQTGLGKEHPDIFLHICSRLSVQPGDCIVFDDVLPAVKSAKKAGMMVYGVYDKYSEKDKSCIKNTADGYIMDFSNAPMPIAAPEFQI